jgi:hypothetical protein
MTCYSCWRGIRRRWEWWLDTLCWWWQRRRQKWWLDTLGWQWQRILQPGNIPAKTLLRWRGKRRGCATLFRVHIDSLVGAATSTFMPASPLFIGTIMESLRSEIPWTNGFLCHDVIILYTCIGCSCHCHDGIILLLLFGIQFFFTCGRSIRSRSARTRTNLILGAPPWLGSWWWICSVYYYWGRRWWSIMSYC